LDLKYPKDEDLSGRRICFIGGSLSFLLKLAPAVLSGGGAETAFAGRISRYGFSGKAA